MTSKIGVGQTADHKPLPMMLGISYDRLPVGSNGMMTHTKQRTAGDKPPKMFLGGIGTEPNDDLRHTRGDHHPVDVGILASRLPAVAYATV